MIHHNDRNCPNYSTTDQSNATDWSNFSSPAWAISFNWLMIAPKVACTGIFSSLGTSNITPSTARSSGFCERIVFGVVMDEMHFRRIALIVDKMLASAYASVFSPMKVDWTNSYLYWRPPPLIEGLTWLFSVKKASKCAQSWSGPRHLCLHRKKQTRMAGLSCLLPQYSAQGRWAIEAEGSVDAGMRWI